MYCYGYTIINEARHYSMTNTAEFLRVIGRRAANDICDAIASHYDISRREAYEEVTDDEAEHLLDYMVEPMRSAAGVLMQRHGMRGF